MTREDTVKEIVDVLWALRKAKESNFKAYAREFIGSFVESAVADVKPIKTDMSNKLSDKRLWRWQLLWLVCALIGFALGEMIH